MRRKSCYGRGYNQCRRGSPTLEEAKIDGIITNSPPNPSQPDRRAEIVPSVRVTTILKMFPSVGSLQERSRDHGNMELILSVVSRMGENGHSAARQLVGSSTH